MKIQVDLANMLTIQSGMLQGGYLTWSLYGESIHQKVQIINTIPPFPIREMSENNYSGFIKLPRLKARDEFKFAITMTFLTTNLKFPFLNFKFSAYQRNMVATYCKRAKYWETNDPELVSIAKNLRASNNDVLNYLKEAFTFVHENIKFRENLDRRLGAKMALKEGRGDCDEFSDLFITLCRINQIPARRVLGIILTSVDNFSLHAWAEVYIPLHERWIPFDVALNEFASIKWTYLVRAHSGLQNEIPLIRFKSKVGKYFRADFEDNDVSQIALLS
ncbi:MAG: transglutaminase-like domain-containing protein [Candidatus Helarchaeota archaeon]